MRLTHMYISFTDITLMIKIYLRTDVPTYLEKSLVKGVRLLFELSTKIPEGDLPYFIIQYADQVFVTTLVVGHGITLLRRT